MANKRIAFPISEKTWTPEGLIDKGVPLSYAFLRFYLQNHMPLEQAISYLARNKANLVLLDYEMPVADGPKVLEMLRADTETGHIPVMFLTGHGDRNSVMSVVGLKPADYLLKTIDKKTLLEKLDHFFRG